MSAIDPVTLAAEVTGRPFDEAAAERAVRDLLVGRGGGPARPGPRGPPRGGGPAAPGRGGPGPLSE